MERKRVCGIRCRNAKGKRCRCVCAGATHGKGISWRLTTLDNITAYIEEKELPVEAVST